MQERQTDRERERERETERERERIAGEKGIACKRIQTTDHMYMSYCGAFPWPVPEREDFMLSSAAS